MALITDARTVKTRAVRPRDIPRGATHLVWVRFGSGAALHPDATRIRFADTKLSAVRAYGAGLRTQHVFETGWMAIPDHARRDWGVTF